jgi:hypothetical protein
MKRRNRTIRNRKSKHRSQKAVETNNQTNEANNAIERSRLLVTVRACARPAPSNRLAHLGR